MAATVKAVLTRNATSVNVSWTGTASGTLPGSAERLVVLLSMRAYAAGATRTMGAEWNGAPVTFRATSLLGTVTAQDDFHYWIGTLNNPTLDAQTLKVTASGLLRGLHATLFFVDGPDDTVPIIVHDYQDRDVSGNSVTLNGTPARAGSVIVSANGIGDATSVASFTPDTWTSAASGQATTNGDLTLEVRYTQAASTAAVETTAQYTTGDVNRGGVLFEIQTAVSAGVGVTESASPSDSVGAPIVAVSVGLTEALAASDSSSASIPSDTPAANPPGVWTGAAASWKLPSGLDSKGGGALTVSGLSAATIKGPGATFTTASYARRTAPGLGALADLSPEFWVKPTAFGHLFYLGPRATGTSVARIWIDAAGAWNVLRTIGAATQSAKSADGAAVLGSTYHVVGVFDSGNNHRLTINGETVTLTMTGAAVTGSNSIGSDDEIALGDPTLASLVGFAGDMGRVTLWPFAMSAGRAKASYRQQNNLAQWVGISGENASSDTNRAPTAVPVQEELTSGVAKTIPVISRAYDPDGDALSIQAGSVVPSNGTASIVSDQVVWTPAPSFVGSAACDFTLRDGGGKTSASKIYATVSAPTVIIGYPKWPMGYTSWTSVPASRIRPVGFGVTGAPGPAGGYTTIAAAYAAAVAGDWIVVDNGTWAGNLTFNRDFADPGIVICGRNIATNGRDPLTILTGKYTVSGDGHWFHHLRISYAGTATDDVQSTSSFEGHPFVVSGARNTWTRNWFTIPKGIQLTWADSTHTNRICYNRWTTTLTAGNSWISMANGHTNPSKNRLHDTLIARNYLRQHTTATYKNSYLIHIGNAHADAGDFWFAPNFRIEENLVIVADAIGYDKFVYLKLGVQSFSRNTLIGPASFIHRHGSILYTTPASAKTESTITCPEWHGNWIEGLSGGYAAAVKLNGTGFDIRGNYIKASDGILLFNGYNDAGGAPYQAASDSLLVGNQVLTPNISKKPYTIGHVDPDWSAYNDTQGHKIRNVNIWGHAGQTVSGGVSSLFKDAAEVVGSTCSFSTGFGSYTAPPAPVKLGETDVGFEVSSQAGTA